MGLFQELNNAGKTTVMVTHEPELSAPEDFVEWKREMGEQEHFTRLFCREHDKMLAVRIMKTNARKIFSSFFTFPLNSQRPCDIILSLSLSLSHIRSPAFKSGDKFVQTVTDTIPRDISLFKGDSLPQTGTLFSFFSITFYPGFLFIYYHSAKKEHSMKEREQGFRTSGNSRVLDGE